MGTNGIRILQLTAILVLTPHTVALNKQLRESNSSLQPTSEIDPKKHGTAVCETGLEFDGILFPCPDKPPDDGSHTNEHSDDHKLIDKPRDYTVSKNIRSFIPSWVAIGVGIVFFYAGRPGWQMTLAIFVLYFGAQTFLNFYMKSTLSGFHLTPNNPNLKGMPAPFLVTALQQFVSFVIIIIGSALSQPTRWKFSPGVKFTKKRMISVLFLSLSFTFNIGLNSLALCVLDISVNLTIRALGPLATALVQQIKAWFMGEGLIDMSWKELALLCIGTLSAVVAVLSKTIHVDSGSNFQNTIVGTIICLASLVAASSELIIVAIMGDMKMNPIEVIANTCLPSVLFLVLPICFIPHPTGWPHTGLSTDLFVSSVIFSLNPMVFGLAVLSGLFAVLYNALLYTCVQKFSPIQAAFASNSNKAGTIVLGLLLGFEKLPRGYCGLLLIIGVVFNISSFAMYAFVKSARTRPAAKGTLKDGITKEDDS